MRLLDLFCCSGMGAEGYARAGFDRIFGVDIEAHHYPHWGFQQGDVLDYLAFSNGWFRENFDAIHASPPCQAYSDLQKRTKRLYPKLIEPVRERLQRIGLPYVIENVEGAPLIDPVMLCGTMFPGLRVLRHRLFESNVEIQAPDQGIQAHKGSHKHPLVFTHDKRKAHYGHLDQDTSFVQVTGGGNCTMKNARAAMGLPADDRRTKHELNEGIPPAYTQHNRCPVARRHRSEAGGMNELTTAIGRVTAYMEQRARFESHDTEGRIDVANDCPLYTADLLTILGALDAPLSEETEPTEYDDYEAGEWRPLGPKDTAS